MMTAHHVQPDRRYRMTLLHDVVAFEDTTCACRDVEIAREMEPGVRRFDVTTTLTPAGTTYEGVAWSVDADGFFELRLDTGEVIGIYAGDERLPLRGMSTVALFRKDRRVACGTCFGRLSFARS